MRNDQAHTLRQLAVAPPSPQGSRRRVIAVTGGKGGVGKSSIAVNLAAIHAQRGSRTLALDGDLGMPDLNLLLGVAPSRTVVDLLDGFPLDEVLIEAHGISLLPGLTGSTVLAELDAPRRAALLQAIDRLAGDFDSLIVDTAAGIGQNVIELAAAADDIVVVATPEPMSIADAYGCLKVLSLQRTIRHAFILPNCVRSPSEANDTVERLAALVARFLDLELTALPAIPYDRALAESAADGVPCVLRSPECPASRALRRAAERLEALSLPDEDRPTTLPSWRADARAGARR